MWGKNCERDDRILGMKLGIVVAGLTALTMGFLSGTGANSTDTSEEKVLEIARSSSWRHEIVQKLVELGEGATPAICSAYAPGEIIPEALEAVARLGSPAACKNLIAHLRAVRQEDVNYTFVAYLRAIRHCRCRGAITDLMEIMTAGQQVRDHDSLQLAFSLEAAAAVVCLGNEQQRSEAREFILTVMREVPVGDESAVRDSLLIAVCLTDTNEGLDFVAEHVVCDFELQEEVFLSLPRDAEHRGLVKALYTRLTQHVIQVGQEPVATMAALEALSEMKSASEVVPDTFWQAYWDKNRCDLVRYSSAQPYPNGITRDMLNARHKTFLERMHIEWDHQSNRAVKCPWRRNNGFGR